MRPTMAPPTAPHRAPLRRFPCGMEVVVGDDLPVGLTVDDDESLYLVRVVLGELLEGIPIIAGWVLQMVGRHVQRQG